ncbi:hypothetical protein CQ12_05615 [Bradyrhizobium jicamae]|uniref:Uncharacterized protein n=1 Tax=Bradyrhizobium jicamae TaxID=280332 RepID=A0A0R3M2L3_9BRAD|nr:hypothetical protein [Bradyrhizobium jicamae]KRR11302.1 hypothetical protein CQ12_05615 [Bradyrhizobium jicamae]
MPKTHCNYGHAMTPENTAIVHPKHSKYPWRQCRTCMDLTQADVEAVEAHMRGGGTFRDLSLPFTKKMGLDIYRALNPEWSEQMLTIARANAREKKKVAFAALAQQRTHCKNGHELTPDNVRIVVVRRNGWQQRECKTCRAEWDKRGRYTAEQITAVVEAVKSGSSIAQVTKRGGDRPALIKFNGLAAAMRADPALENLLRPLSRRNNVTALRARWIGLRSNVTRGPTLTGIIAAPPNEIFTAVDNAVPRNIDFHQRKEIMSEMMLAILEERLVLEDVRARYPEFLRASYRMFAHRSYGDIRTPLPLDAPAYLEGTMLRVETVSTPFWEQV